MKQIINRKIYNTETATELSTFSRGAYNDFNHIEETLYRTPKGAWFTVGGGGPRSKYATPVPGGGMGGDSDVFSVLTDDEAYEWLERNQETALIEEYFPQEIEEA